MASTTVLNVAEHTDPSFIYLALYYDDVRLTANEEWPSDRLSWRLIPSQSPTFPADEHEIFGIDHDDNSLVEDPTLDICAFVRLPIKSTKSYDSLVNQVRKCSETFVSEAIDDGWQEWEWVYNMCEHLEVLEYLDDCVTNTWQYRDQSKMEIFKDRVLTLAKQVHEANGPPEDRVIDFPLGS